MERQYLRGGEIINLEPEASCVRGAERWATLYEQGIHLVQPNRLPFSQNVEVGSLFFEPFELSTEALQRHLPPVQARRVNGLRITFEEQEARRGGVLMVPVESPRGSGFVIPTIVCEGERDYRTDLHTSRRTLSHIAQLATQLPFTPAEVAA